MLPDDQIGGLGAECGVIFVSMNTKSVRARPNNDRLWQLVDLSELMRLGAHRLFNEGLGSFGYSYEYWRGFFCKPGSQRFEVFGDEHLARAEKVLGGLKSG